MLKFIEIIYDDSCLSTLVYEEPKLRPKANDDDDGAMHAYVRVRLYWCMCACDKWYTIREKEKKWARLIFLRIQRSQPIKTQA